ncbi:MAG: hypothetical protein KDA37_14225 [Planctomycetales bacterium]|nr:hypothetical protein [Planctomycetales bacterium]
MPSRHASSVAGRAAARLGVATTAVLAVLAISTAPASAAPRGLTPELMEMIAPGEPTEEELPRVRKHPQPSGGDSLLKPVSPFWESGPSDSAEVAGNDDLRDPHEPRPNFLDRPLEPGEVETPAAPLGDEPLDFGLVQYEREPPLGFSGKSGVAPTEYQESAHFVPREDRWRIGFPYWDRYDRGHPLEEDYPYKEGHWWDPYNQNVLKGDYPIIGQHTFMNLTVSDLVLNDFRQTPVGTTPFESTVDPHQEEFFGDPNQYLYSHFMLVNFDLQHGNAGFKPIDWRLRVESVFNRNIFQASELGVVYPDVRRGRRRTRDFQALDQWFVEAKLADLGPDYDFLSVRAGSQLFVSDFRGFVFKDVNRGVRLFGTRFANRDQFNIIYFDQTEKDTNSLLNTFDDRSQNTLVLNYFRQDLVYPGFTGLISFHYNNEQPSTKFDSNGFLVRPDPAGVYRPHQVDAYYLGIGGDGHIGRVNVQTQFYQVFGNDSLNPIGGAKQTINAQMAALELSVDRDWVRFRTSYFFASGDSDPNDYKAEGFDTILDDPIFAGGEFSYWQRQGIRLFGVNLVQNKSLVPNLRSSKTQGQSNFVNPGLHLVNVGMDVEVTPKLKVITNANYLWFDQTEVLETFTFQGNIKEEIGTDLSIGMEYRPLHNDNVIFVLGYAALIPDQGFKDLFGQTTPFTLAGAQADAIDTDTKHAAFVEMALTY